MGCKEGGWEGGDWRLSECRVAGQARRPQCRVAGQAGSSDSDMSRLGAGDCDVTCRHVS